MEKMKPNKKKMKRSQHFLRRCSKKMKRMRLILQRGRKKFAQFTVILPIVMCQNKTEKILLFMYIVHILIVHFSKI